MNYCKIKSGLIVFCYGITKFPDDGNYAMVLSCKDGNLRDYLQENHSKLTLKDRIIIFRCLCESLDDIHEKDLIHCDLHSGNILIEDDGCYITDLGLCGPVDDDLSNKIYGIVSYIAPEILQGKKNTKKSDVYSVGMLMWEIFAGRPPFDDIAHDCYLIFQICKGLRPPTLPEIPDDYAQMMQKCLDVNPCERPTIWELLVFADNKLEEIYKNENLKNHSGKDAISLFKKLFKFSKIKKKSKKCNNNNSNIISSGNNGSQKVHKSHPLVYHTSRILDDEIAKSKNLKSNDSLLSDLDINSVI